MYKTPFLLAALVTSSAWAVPLAGNDGAAKRSALPFNELVVFGDQLSDNGAGSWRHGLDPDNIYGHYTWTDGPIYAQYLAQQLGVQLVDYAWGGWHGGGLVGSTIDNSYTPAKDMYQGRPVPSTHDQIFSNYTGHGRPANIGRSLQVIWAGQNDIKHHTNWYAHPATKITVDYPTNAGFIRDFSAHLLPQAEHLIQLGAPAVVVMNLFPLHSAPEATRFYCKHNTLCVQNWGKVISAANAHLKASVAASKYASKIIYYDVYGYMMNIMANKNAYGFTESLSYVCDGDAGNPLPYEKWDQCRKNKPSWSAARPFFWFANGNMETHVHQFIAGDMAKTIHAHFGGAGGGSGSW